MRFRSLLSYAGLFMLAYTPQIVASIEPIKSNLRDSPPITIASFSLRSVFIVVMVLSSLIIVYSYYMSYKMGGYDKKYVFSFFIFLLILVGISTLYILLSKGIVTIEFVPQMIPILISSIIGVVGSFILSCLLIPNCDSRPRFEKQKVMHPLYNK